MRELDDILQEYAAFMSDLSEMDKLEIGADFLCQGRLAKEERRLNRAAHSAWKKFVAMGNGPEAMIEQVRGGFPIPALTWVCESVIKHEWASNTDLIWVVRCEHVEPKLPNRAARLIFKREPTRDQLQEIAANSAAFARKAKRWLGGDRSVLGWHRLFA